MAFRRWRWSFSEFRDGVDEFAIGATLSGDEVFGDKLPADRIDVMAVHRHRLCDLVVVER